MDVINLIGRKIGNLENLDLKNMIVGKDILEKLDLMIDKVIIKKELVIEYLISLVAVDQAIVEVLIKLKNVHVLYVKKKGIMLINVLVEINKILKF